MSLLKSLAKLGATHRMQLIMQLIPSYEGDILTLTMILTSKDEKGPQFSPVQVIGTVDEVEAEIAKPEFEDIINKVAESTSTLDQLNKQIEDAKKAKEAALAAAKKQPASGKPAPKPVPKSAVEKKPITSLAKPAVPSLTPAFLKKEEPKKEPENIQALFANIP